MLKWLRNWLSSKEVIEDKLQKQINFMSAAAEAFEADYVMIISVNVVEEGHQVKLLSPEGTSPLKMLGLAHKTMIEEPSGSNYSRHQIQMQIDYWLDILSEYERENNISG